MEVSEDPRKSKNTIVRKSFEFSLQIIEFAAILEEKKRFVIANQLLRSGTSIGANIWEAQHAESRADFIHKLKIAAKEAKETEYWLLLCKLSPNHPALDNELSNLLEIQKLLSSIISSARMQKI